MNIDEIFSITDKKILVFGASGGLAKAVAVSLASNGAHVFAQGRNSTALQSLVSAGEMADGKITPVELTLEPSDYSTWSKKLLEVTDHSFDAVINFVGINRRGNLVEQSVDDFDEVITTNLITSMRISKFAMNHFIGKSFGRLINIASIFSHVTYPGRSAYSASKAGLLQMTRTIALEIPQGVNITANTISPGPFLTPLNEPVTSNKLQYDKFCERISQGRFGAEHELLTSVIYLLSEYSSYVNGADIRVDSGWTVA